MPLPTDPVEVEIRWPLTDDNTGLEKFSRVLSSFSKLSDIYSAFWCFQMLAGLLMILVMIDSMDFQKRLGTVYATIKRCWYDLAIFAVCFLVLSLPSAMFFNITVGPYYDKMATLGDAFYHVTFSNVAGSQVDIATEMINIMRAQGITGLSAMSLYVMIYGLPLLYGWVMLSFLFAIIGDAYTEVKAEFQNSPTLYQDVRRLALQVRHRKKSSSGRILTLMEKLEETKEQKDNLREMLNYLTGLQSKKNWVHLGEKTMGPEELREHIGYSQHSVNIQ